jgi:glycosyltransferase involved in cell wall biosynthesis
MAMNINNQVPYFSIIVPTSNRPEVLINALMSIKAQTFNDFEVIVVDDGSSSEARAEYPLMWKELDPRFKLYIVGESGADRKGPAYIRNYGMSNSNSDFLAYLDDDDLWSEENHLKTAASFLSNNSDTDLYVANQKGIKGGIMQYETWLKSYDNELSKWECFGNSHYQVNKSKALSVNEFPSLNMVIINREFQEKVGPLNNSLSYCEDLEFMIRSIDLAKKMVYTPKVIATHYISDRTLSNSASSRLSELEKLHVYVYIGTILVSICKSKSGRKRGRMLTGWAFKQLAHASALESRYSTASYFAKLGTSAWISSTFLLYNAFWFFRSFFSKS